MKQIITSDIHIRTWDNDELIDGIPKRLYNLLNVFEDICKYAISNNIEYINILGDINHKNHIVHTYPFLKFCDIIKKYSNDIRFIILHGNHDVISTEQENKSSLDLINPLFNNEGEYYNVKLVIDKPEVINDILYIPWSNSLLDDIEQNKDKSNILFSHFPLNGAVMSNGLQYKGRIKPSDLKDFKYVFLGDIHKPQNIQHKNTNIYYCGSIIKLDKGEYNDNKRFIIFDNETEEFEDIPIEEYIKNVELNVTEENEDEVLNEIKNLTNDPTNNVIVRNKSGKASKILKDSAYNIKFIDESDYEYTDRKIDISSSLDSQMREYMNIKGIEDKPTQDNYINVFEKYVSEEENGK